MNLTIAGLPFILLAYPVFYLVINIVYELRFGQLKGWKKWTQ